jgi:hypothetical protein
VGRGSVTDPTRVSKKIINIKAYSALHFEYHSPLDPQLNDLPDADFMEDPSYSDKRTQTLVKLPSIQMQKKIDEILLYFFFVVESFFNIYT